MSLILFALSTLEKNDNQIPLCTLPIRKNNCGIHSEKECDPFICHYKPNELEILTFYGYNNNQILLDNFIMPQNWVCNEYMMFALRNIQEEANRSDNSLNGFIEKRNTKDSFTRTMLLEEKKENLKEGFIREILNKNTMKEIINDLEKNNMICYYVHTKKHIADNTEGIKVIICYQEFDKQKIFTPNNSFKVILEVFYRIDGFIDILNHLITTDEEISFNKIIEFEKGE